jgi:hypothetical protein
LDYQLDVKVEMTSAGRHVRDRAVAAADARGIQLTQPMLIVVLRRTSSVRLLRTLEFLVYR